MSSTPDIGIGSRLRTARQRRGWNREALAIHSGISWSAIAQVECGRRKHLRPQTLFALARALGVTADYLIAGRASVPMLCHRALLYDSDEAFLAVAVPFLAEAAERSEAALVVTGEANIKLLRGTLGELAGQVEFAERASWYRTPTAALRGYEAFLDARIEAGAPWVSVIGEPVWAGRSAPEVQAWARYESLLNLSFGGAPLTVLCPYDRRELDDEIIAQACATHSHSVEREVLKANPEFTDPRDFVLER